jgi:hypothetical protein
MKKKIKKTLQKSKLLSDIYNLIKYFQKKRIVMQGITFDHTDLYYRQVNNLIFIHIPKAAGMSIVDALYNDKKSHHAKIIDYQKQDKDKFYSSYFFAISRNPYTRAYSAYKYLSNGGMQPIDKVWKNIYIKKHTSFERFILHGLEKAINENAEHFIPQYKFIEDKDNIVACDFIGKIEELNTTQEYLKKHNIDFPIEHLNQSNKDPLIITDIYTREMLDKINLLYKKDFLLLGYNTL